MQVYDESALELAKVKALLEHVAQAKTRCEQIACDVEGVDSQCADACRFDAGSLSACQRILETLHRGGDILADIAALIGLIAALNTERGEDAP